MLLRRLVIQEMVAVRIPTEQLMVNGKPHTGMRTGRTPSNVSCWMHCMP